MNKSELNLWENYIIISIIIIEMIILVFLFKLGIYAWIF